jgi:hypothetical protein
MQPNKPQYDRGDTTKWTRYGAAPDETELFVLSKWLLLNIYIWSNYAGLEIPQASLTRALIFGEQLRWKHKDKTTQQYQCKYKHPMEKSDTDWILANVTQVMDIHPIHQQTVYHLTLHQLRASAFFVGALKLSCLIFHFLVLLFNFSTLCRCISYC